MVPSGVGEDLSVALVNALLLALWAVLPGLLLWYARQSLTLHRLRPEFWLRKSEQLELQRAARLYQNVCQRLAALDEQRDAERPFWRAVFARTADHPSEERDDLEAHAQHLRTTIARLKRRPLLRLKTWMHLVSARFALARALATDIITLALFTVAFHVAGQPAAAADAVATSGKALVWYPFDERLFYANAIAACFAGVAGPVFYLLRWASLRRQYALEFCTFGELAAADPQRILEHTPASDAEPDFGAHEPADELNEASSWFAVLGLSPSATLDEIKEAYKALIKQNHPDRVHGMSPVFRRLAEVETKKINAAYRQALSAVAAVAA